MTPIAARPRRTRNQRILRNDGSRYPVIVFDMGGTLLEYENTPWTELYPRCLGSAHRYLKSVCHAAPMWGSFWQRFQLMLDRARMRQRTQNREYRFGDLARELLRGFDITLLPEQMEQFKLRYYGVIRRQVTLYADAPAMLSALRRGGATIGLLSNTPFRRRDHVADLKRFGLLPLIDHALFTANLTHRKPHPAAFQAILARCNAAARDSVYIGDRELEDVEGPRAIGMRGVLIRRPHRVYDRNASPDATITQLAQLPAILGYGN